MNDFVDRVLRAPGPRLRPLAPNVFDPGAPRLPGGGRGAAVFGPGVEGDAETEAEPETEAEAEAETWVSTLPSGEGVVGPVKGLAVTGVGELSYEAAWGGGLLYDVAPGDGGGVVGGGGGGSAEGLGTAGGADGLWVGGEGVRPADGKSGRSVGGERVHPADGNRGRPVGGEDVRPRDSGGVGPAGAGGDAGLVDGHRVGRVHPADGNRGRPVGGDGGAGLVDGREVGRVHPGDGNGAGPADRYAHRDGAHPVGGRGGRALPAADSDRAARTGRDAVHPMDGRGSRAVRPAPADCDGAYPADGGGGGRGLRPVERKKTGPAQTKAVHPADAEEAHPTADATHTAQPEQHRRAHVEATPPADGSEVRPEAGDGVRLAGGTDVRLNGAAPSPSAASRPASGAGSWAEAPGVGRRERGDDGEPQAVRGASPTTPASQVPDDAAASETPRAEQSRPSPTGSAISHHALPIGSASAGHRRGPTTDEPPVRRQSRPERPVGTRTHTAAPTLGLREALGADRPPFPTGAGTAPQGQSMSPGHPGAPLGGSGMESEDIGSSTLGSTTSPPPAPVGLPVPVPPSPSPSPSSSPSPKPPTTSPSPSDDLPQPPPARPESPLALAPEPASTLTSGRTPHLRSASPAATTPTRRPATPPPKEPAAHATVVRVTIDHLVVRTAPPRPVDAPPPPPHRKPRLSLEEYLGRRA